MADLLILKTGGRLEGVLANPDQDPRTEYIIRLDTGGEVTLAADQVEQFLPTSEAQRRYKALLKRMPPTADGNWRMSEWCGDKGLKDERKLHLEKVLEFDPNHAQARRALGYSFLGGEWVRQADYMRRRGYELYQGRWRLLQDIELDQKREREDLAIKEWTKNIKRWRGWLGKKYDAQGWENILAIEDPLAAASIAGLLQDEADPRVIQTYIRVLGKLRTPVATRSLIQVVLGPAPDELRQLALDQLENYGADTAIDAFIIKLESPENLVIRRAALGLIRLQHERAIRPLIDALVTEHKIQLGGNSDQISTAFNGSGSGGTGGIGFGSGGGPKVVIKQVQNREVLDALLQVADGANYQFDQVAWLNWYIYRNAPKTSSLRRSD